jgi:hypothetical protein
MDFLKLDQYELNESIAIADNEVLEESSTLRKWNAKTIYQPRFAEFEQLGIDASGMTSFTPEVHTDFVEDFIHELSETPIYLPQFEERLRDAKSVLKSHLMDTITNDDIVNNTTPKRLMDNLDDLEIYVNGYIKIKEVIGGLRTPKLSKFLVKAFGEDARITKHFNSLPRKAVKEKQDDYKICISVLPHHIAGMSYYSSANWGGDGWDGENGTSCQDTKRSGSGSYVLRVPPNLLDATLGIAWLSFTEDDCIYQARALIRLVRWEGNPFFIISRLYGTERTATHLLLEGLKSKFSNMVQNLEMQCSAYSEQVIVEVNIPQPIERKYTRKETCYTCSGKGRHTIITGCTSCDIVREIACAHCIEGCSNCDNTGFHECDMCHGTGDYEITNKCGSCEGTGYIEYYSDPYTPYSDDGFIHFSNSCISYTVNQNIVDKFKIEEERELYA